MDDEQEMTAELLRSKCSPLFSFLRWVTCAFLRLIIVAE